MEKFEKLKSLICLAHKDYESQLVKELGDFDAQYGRLYLSQKVNRESLPVWAQDTWFDPVKISVSSISKGAKALKSLGKNWVNFPVAKFRRAALIQEALPKFSVGRIEFPVTKNLPSFGCWALVDENTIVASTKTLKNVPLGQYEFVENKVVPPNRAYLKLWEVFTTLGVCPKKGERCLDLGSSPGGWSWVLQTLGAKVISVDKAELNPKISSLPGIEFLEQSAFALEPQDVGAIDWFFSDIICYPDKLYQLVKKWMEAGVCKNFVCTIKFQGETDFKMIDQFLKIAGAQVLHLYHNKHEVTFVSLNNIKN